MATSRALTRLPAADFAAGLSSRDTRDADHERYLGEHAAYVAALDAAGLAVDVLPALPEHPDGQFVEDVAVVTPEVAVLTRPGARSRRGEVDPIADALPRRGGVERIVAPGTLDGGDVLIVDRCCFIGRSARTNATGAAQLAAILEPHGYSCREVVVRAGLHLKSSVTSPCPDTLLRTPVFAGEPAFDSFRQIETASGEEDAANVLRAGDRLLIPAGFPATAERLAAIGLDPFPVRIDETRRMDGGLTCLSIVF